MRPNKTFSSVYSAQTLRRTFSVAAAAAALVLAGCATTTPPVELSSARVSVNRAAINPLVTQHAPAELKAATEAMAAADAAWIQKKNAEEARQLAYIATKKAAAAEHAAQARTQGADTTKDSTAQPAK